MTADRATLKAALDDATLRRARVAFDMKAWHGKETADAAMRRVLVDRLVEALRPTGEWQPIETAPKDGTLVLLWSERPVVGHWQAAVNHYAWREYESFRVVCEVPTHWQPLPMPPAHAQTPEG